MKLADVLHAKWPTAPPPHNHRRRAMMDSREAFEAKFPPPDSIFWDEEARQYEPRLSNDEVMAEQWHGMYLAWKAALSQPAAAPAEQWISCKDQMPDADEIVWPWYPGDCHEFDSGPCTGSFMKLIANEYRGAKWMPTCLKRPQPPKENKE